MNIALMAHDQKKDLMIQFCTAYTGILSGHKLYATATTGKMVAESTGLSVELVYSCLHGGSQQIGARIACNEMDMVLFFANPKNAEQEAEASHIARLCDQNSIPFASNIATAEILVLGLQRGDLNWRKVARSTQNQMRQRPVRVCPLSVSIRIKNAACISGCLTGYAGGKSYVCQVYIGLRVTPDSARWQGQTDAPGRRGR